LSAPAKSNATDNKKFVDDRGERGHFYYAEKCEDCFYKADKCGCDPTLEYFACVTKHCHKASAAEFADKCTAHGTKCSDDLDISCRGEDTTCQSKAHQLPHGGIGLTVDVSEADAFCGPFGKCIGKLHLTAKISGKAVAPSAPVAAAPGAASPAPAVAGAPAAVVIAVETEPLWLECGLPKVANADINHKKDWNICRSAAEGEAAECDLSLPTKWLGAAQKKKIYCVLTDGENGKRLTQPAWHNIINVHEKMTKEDKEAEDDEKAADAKAEKKTEKKAEEKAKKEEKKAEKKAEKKVDLHGSDDCRCIGIDEIEGETVILFKRDGNVSYPADLGAHCEAWDAKTHPSCEGKGESACEQAWCYVDPCKCKNVADLPKPSAYLPEGQYKGKPVHFSYATCGGKDSYSAEEEKKTAKDLEKTCAVEVDDAKWGADNCRCVGIGPQPGSTKVTIKDKQVDFPADVGSTCTAWEEDNHPECAGEKPPAWCSQKWCYVDPCSCKLPTPPKTSSYVPDANYQGKPVYYSYATCGGKDEYTKGRKEACVNMNTSDACGKLDKCAWTGKECLGKELVEVCEKKEEKVEKKEEKKEEKVEKKEEKKEKKVEKKEEEEKKEEGIEMGFEGEKLPWMADKEKRQAARAEEEAKEPKEEKKEEKADKVEGVKDQSGLPWMKGDVNDKAPVPGAAAVAEGLEAIR